MLDKIFSQHPTIYKYDRTWIGLVTGLIVPTSGIPLVYLLSVINHYRTGDEIVPIYELLHSLSSLMLLSKFLSVGCILNLGVFFLFINRDYYNVSRGIIYATMLIALPVVAVTVKGWFG